MAYLIIATLYTIVAGTIYEYKSDPCAFTRVKPIQKKECLNANRTKEAFSSARKN